jgi:hypothetical protein
MHKPGSIKNLPAPAFETKKTIAAGRKAPDAMVY